MKHTWLKNFGFFLVALSLLLNPLYVVPAYALSAPTPIAPTNGLVTDVVNTPPLGIPEFQWSGVAGATTYRLQVSNDIGFTTLAVDVVTPNTAFTPPGAWQFGDGTWYWRVRVESPGPVSSYSGTWNFTKQWASPANAPALTSPDNGATVAFYDPPVFSWSSVTGAAYYKIQIYSSPGGWASSIYSSNTLTTTHQPHYKLANGTYYWRVVPVDTANREGTPSNERSFVAGYNFLPNLIEPADNATPTFTPTFRWQAVRGAQFYRLQYTTDPTFSAGVTQIDTPNTSYTPTVTLPNDVNYYWRVRVHSGNSISDWTPSRKFLKKWYIKPTTLTPTNLYQHVRFPVFSWTPVPGASYYKVDISLYPNFSEIRDSGTTSNTFYTPQNYWGSLDTYYWRVTPFDGNNHPGVPSNTVSYVSYGTSLAPQQIYPLFYYPPDTYAGYPGITTNPHEDRTVALPIFMWHRVFLYPPFGNVYADAYRLEVSIDPLFLAVDWTVDTQNTIAAPTASNPFTPTPGVTYYWRVRPLVGGVEAGQWSQIWRARFNPALALPATTGAAPTLLRPTTGFEYAEFTPLLEWFPLSGATAYDVQISLDQGFTSIVNSATVSSPAYVPTQSLAQRSLGAIDFGVYYWRVRQSPSGAWSATQRFQIAAQSQWNYARTLGSADNQLQIGSDPAGDIGDSDYDLTNLQAAQDKDYWYFGFAVPTAPSKNVTYAMYLDLDHQDGSGATSDARNYSVNTIQSHRPEYIVYVLQQAGAFATNRVFVYHWNGIDWDTPQSLDSIGGQLNKTGNYVEIRLPNTAIGYQDNTGSYSVSLLSLPAASGQAQDSVPSDPAIPGAGPVSRFANVTERMNLLMPPNDAGDDPSTFPSILPFFWDYPVLSPWSGAFMEAHLDPAFTSKQADYVLTSDTAFYASTSHAWGTDFSGDNTYYWRVQPRYREGFQLISGVWSQGWRFERKGFIPQNLTTSVTFATPTFSWDMVEGAESYDLQVDDDPNFASPAVNINTRQVSFTDTGTLENGTYYWRVRVRRNGNAVGSWTPSRNFTLALPAPTDLTTIPSGNIGRAPTLCWTPLIKNSPVTGDPVLAAYTYRVQVSKEPTFSSIFDERDFTEQSCWTPIKGYDDGQYYWRVAMRDGNGRMGNFSPAATFTKQYPITSLVSPVTGSTTNNTPTFVWTHVNGAARYRFQSSKFPTFAPIYEDVTTDNVRWTPPWSYDPGFTYYWRVAIIDNDNRIGPFIDATLIYTDPNPSVNAITLMNENPTNLANVQFGVIFSKPVTGVDVTDFILTKTGSITGESIGQVSGSSANYVVTVNTGSGSGTLRLDVPIGATITDLSGNPLSGLPYTSGAVYTVTKGSIPYTWVGGISIQSDQSVVAVARPHLGTQVTSYIGATTGSTTQYVPMLFKGAFGGSYNSALYVQNVSNTTANLTLEFINGAGAVVYTKFDNLNANASKGYWLPSEASLPAGFAGGVKVTSTENILAVGRPHIGTQIMTYNGVASGATVAYLPMFFKNGFGNYNTALYIQNVTNNTASLTIQYLNLNGTVACTDNDTLSAKASKGYWSLTVACDTGSLPMGFVGGVKVTSNQDILAVGRAHLGAQITTFNGFSSGSSTAYVPMLFKNAFANGSYKAALYLQNVTGSSATVSIQYINDSGATAATQNVTLAAGAISSIWLPSVPGLPDGFVGGARISSTQNIVAVGRPHLGAEITAYNGTSSGSTNAYLPMLFKNAYTNYQSAFYVQNTTGSTANVTIRFYDSAGVLSCMKNISLSPYATQGFWMASVSCAP